MLGLGDIVIPGLFVALCLKYDVDVCIKKNVKSLKQFSLPFFTTSFIGYIAGIVATFAAMYIFDHPQPALLFLVPTCTLSVLVLSLVKGNLQELKAYDSAPATQEADKKLKEGTEQKNN